MTFPRRLFAGLLLAAAALMLTPLGTQLATQPAHAQMSGTERQAVEEVVRDYLLENPEIIMEALGVLERRSQERQESRQREGLSEHRVALEEDPAAPVLGNPEGDVTLVEFFDYQCGYCKQVSEPLQALLREDPNLRLVMKEFPILGPASLVGARAALAAQRQGGYEELHWALMAHRGQLTEDQILDIAEDTGLDIARLRQDMNDPTITEQLRSNHALAEALEIRGTPAFIVGDRLLPGAVGLDSLRQLIAEARAES